MWLAAPVCPFAPLKLSPKATSITSIPTLASSAVLAQKFAPARLSFLPHDSRAIARNTTNIICDVLHPTRAQSVAFIYTRMCNSFDNNLSAAISGRTLILDGALGSVARQLVPECTGSTDSLCLTHPEVIARIHREYINAGADIITTNTLCANDAAMPSHDVVAINRAAVQLAVEAASNASRKIWVAGSICPVTTEAVYTSQAETLIANGVDALLIETIYDTHNARAAINGVAEAMNNLGREVPVMLSATLTPEGRLPSGENLQDFIAVASECRTLLSIGLNCGYGPITLGQYLPELAQAGMPLSFHPNAGLPNSSGLYDITPEEFVTQIAKATASTRVCILGGCCGTTPVHIAACQSICGTPDDFQSAKSVPHKKCSYPQV